MWSMYTEACFVWEYSGYIVCIGVCRYWLLLDFVCDCVFSVSPMFCSNFLSRFASWYGINYIKKISTCALHRVVALKCGWLLEMRAFKTHVLITDISECFILYVVCRNTSCGFWKQRMWTFRKQRLAASVAMLHIAVHVEVTSGQYRTCIWRTIFSSYFRTKKKKNVVSLKIYIVMFSQRGIQLLSWLMCATGPFHVVVAKSAPPKKRKWTLCTLAWCCIYLGRDENV